MDKIEIKCEGTSLMNWQNIEDVQQGVKDISPENMERLLHSMKVYGFSEPLCVWNDPNKPSRFICISGNQRLKALRKAVELKWDVPVDVPVNFIKAENENQAKQVLLSLASYFGQVNQNESSQFLADLKLDSYEDLSKILKFPDVSLNFDNIKKIADGLSKNVTEHLESFDKGSVKEENAIDMLKIPCPVEKIPIIKSLIKDSFKKMKQENTELKFDYEVIEKILLNYLS